MNWLERAQRELSEACQNRPANTAIRKIGNFKNGGTCTANSDERNLTAVMAVPNREICEKSKGPLAAAPAELKDCRTVAAASVPEPYLDGWARLQSQRPASIPEFQWRQALNAAGRFLDEWGTLAETFDWSPGDLFDVPRDGRPGGLAWFLIGETVRALGPDHAITTSGRVFDRRQGGSHVG
jgi:hypothetical protein